MPLDGIADFVSPAIPDFKIPPLPKIDIRDYRLADYSYDVIKKRIKEFEEDLDDEHEVAVKLASFGQSITMGVTDIGYSNPSTLIGLPSFPMYSWACPGSEAPLSCICTAQRFWEAVRRGGLFSQSPIKKQRTGLPLFPLPQNIA